MSVRTRFAPSPTGPLHLGSLRTALYNLLFARSHNGSFILRVEDTDAKRTVPGSEAAMSKLLAWAGIKPDEGPLCSGSNNGAFGSYRQSERSLIYQSHMTLLRDKGLAYPCFCSDTLLNRDRQIARANGSSCQGYSGRCRKISEAERSRRIDAGDPYVLRLNSDRASLLPNLTVHDLIYGDVHFEKSASVHDIVLMKSTGLPTYHFANVIDDHEMEISHVLRGHEWLSSTPIHLTLYSAFGWKPPAFAHLPLIVDPRGGKLSKRRCDVSVDHFLQRSYSPKALINFVALLGWTPPSTSHVVKEDHDVFLSIDSLTENFSLDGVASHNVALDMGKLEFLANRHVAASIAGIDGATSVDDWLIPELRHWLGPGDGSALYSDEYLKHILPLIAERTPLMRDAVENMSYFWHNPTGSIPLKLWGSEGCRVVTLAIECLESVSSCDFTTLEGMKILVADISRTLELKPNAVLRPLRAALTRVQQGPPVVEIMTALGPALCLQRLQSALTDKVNTLK